VEARGCSIQASAVLGDDGRRGSIEACVGSVEAAVRGSHAQGRLLVAETVGKVAKPVGLQTVAALDGAVESEGHFVDAL
jgi:hypothetical protein